MRSRRSVVVMLGTDFGAFGGIAAVVNVYRDAGMFDDGTIVYVKTHCEGGRVRKALTAISAWLRVVALLLCGKVALLHAHTTTCRSFLRKSTFFLPMFLLQKPVICHLHSATLENYYHSSGTVLRWWIRQVFRRAACVIALSTSWAERVLEIEPATKVSVIPNPIPYASLPVGKRLECSLLFLGRLEERKGVFDLLHAVALLRDRYPSLRLLCGGDGDQERVRCLAKTLNLEHHVDVLGWVGREEKSKLLSTCTAYVLPSYAEGLPMALLEAMSAGMPVVTTPVGGIPDVVSDKVEGMLVQPGNVLELADALFQLLQDSALRARLGEAARHKVCQEFGAENIVTRIRDIHNMILCRVAGRRRSPFMPTGTV